MKVLIISDIHGSAKAAGRIEQLARDVDLILCLGDILYHGPRNDLPEGYNPKEVIRIMNSLAEKVVAVRGNCEAEVDQMVLDFPVMGTTSTVFIDSKKFTLSHGHIYNESNLPKGTDVFLYGHTHIPVAHHVDGTTVFNPGSTSIPKGGWKASYGLYQDGRLEVRSLDDDSVLLYLDI